jgi:hypothetical protein
VSRTIQGPHDPTASDVGQPQQGASSLAEPFVDALPLGTTIPFTADHTPDPDWLETPGAATDP